MNLREREDIAARLKEVVRELERVELVPVAQPDFEMSRKLREEKAELESKLESSDPNFPG